MHIQEALSVHSLPEWASFLVGAGKDGPPAEQAGKPEECGQHTLPQKSHAPGMPLIVVSQVRVAYAVSLGQHTGLLEAQCLLPPSILPVLGQPLCAC